MIREINVDLLGPMFVLRAFLPLIYGRTDIGRRDRSERVNNSQFNTFSDGGRIVNVSSIITRIPMNGMFNFVVCMCVLCFWIDGLMVSVF